MIALWNALLSSDKILLTGPVRPDGDSIGACLALREALAQRNVQADVAGEIVERYAWLEGAEHFLSDEALAGKRYDMVVILDGDKARLTPGAQRCFDLAKTKAIIDHHASTEEQGYDCAWLHPSAASTCEMLFNLFQVEGIDLKPSIARCLYTGFVFDTGSFRYSNTSPKTHRMAASLLETGIDHAAITARILLERSTVGLRAAGRVYSEARFDSQNKICLGVVSLEMADELGIRGPDLEGIVDNMVFTSGVEIAAIAIQREPNLVKFSLRSRATANVCTIAQNLSPTGGGHRKAAGTTLHGDLQQCLDAFLAEARAEIIRIS